MAKLGKGNLLTWPFGDYLDGKDAESNPYGALNPEQIQVNKLLGSRFNTLLQGPQYYSGQLTEPISEGEQTSLDNYNRSSLLANGTLDKLINTDEAGFNENFQREMVDPAYDNFKRNTQPLIDEALPTFSTERGYASQRSLSDLNNNLNTTRFAAREAMKDRSLQAIRDFISKGQMDMALNAVPRGIKQAGLDKKYIDWISANDRYGQDINAAINFLGISTGTYIPAQPGMLEQLLKSVGQGAGMAAGASLFA